MTACMELVVFRGKHVVDAGQVKSLGNGAPQELVEASLGRMAALSFGSNSAGIQTTRAVAGSRTQQMAMIEESCSRLLRIVKDIMGCRRTNATCARKEGFVIREDGRLKVADNNAGSPTHKS